MVVFFSLASGCKVAPVSIGPHVTFFANGKAFSAGCNDPLAECVQGRIQRGEHLLYLSGKGDAGALTIVLSNSNGYFQSGTYSLADTSGDFAWYTDYSRDISHYYSTDSFHTGFVYLTIDTVNLVIAGTFSFVAKFQTDTTTMRISQGHFSEPYMVD